MTGNGRNSGNTSVDIDSSEVAESTIRVVVHPDAHLLAEAGAARFITYIIDRQCESDRVDVVLTGGTIGIAMLAAISHDPACGAIDWTGVHLWWGDERFLTAGDPDRNVTQAEAALLTELNGIIPDINVHPMPAKDTNGGVSSPQDAARLYAKELRRFAREGEVAPHFDLVLLGVGPDGHIASLFPYSGDLFNRARTVVGVEDSPKPPAQRVSLTLPLLCKARQVWLMASGREKARAVAAGIAGVSIDEVEPTNASEASGQVRRISEPSDRIAVPAAFPRGELATLWLLDVEACALVARSGR